MGRVRRELGKFVSIFGGGGSNPTHTQHFQKNRLIYYFFYIFFIIPPHTQTKTPTGNIHLTQFIKPTAGKNHPHITIQNNAHNENHAHEHFL